MSRILPKTDYKDGQVLYGSDLNASNEVIKAGVDDNYTLILKIQDNMVDKDYIDKALINKVDKTVFEEALSKKVDSTVFEETVKELSNKFDNDYVTKIDFDLVKNDVDGIKSGTVKVENAINADNITGINEASTHSYYGTDYDGNKGFFKVPDGIFAEDMSDTGAVSVDGIYYIPHDNSISEEKLTEEVRTKLNETTVTNYNQLSNKPSINGISLEGNKTLDDLGIQPKGTYLTSIPDTYVQTDDLSDYAKTTDVNNSLGTITENLETFKSNVRETYAVIQIGDSFVGTPKTGDMLITL